MAFWPRPGWLEDRARNRRVGQQIYDAIVAQARSAAFYRDMGVPDTVHGRFEMIVLHVALVLGRLQADAERAPEAGRAMLAAFVADMDDACRRLGIGDMGVPRQVKKATAAVMQRGRAYALAMSQAPTAAGDPLGAELVAHVWHDAPPASRDAPLKLAGYVRNATISLAEQDLDALTGGRPAFPDPAVPT